METDHIITGDAFDILSGLPSESAHAAVTDPPYGLAFMGRDWDDFEPREYQEWCREWAREVKRVLKPGGHLLAFSGTRTYHRLACGIEDAGFEVRDKVDWLYGSGFPKALDVGKAIDEAEGESDNREVVGHKRMKSLEDAGEITKEKYGIDKGAGVSPGAGSEDVEVTAPASEAAREWDGWKTGLKPGHEPICVARKPFEGTVAECVQEHGTSALNIDGCRIGLESGETKPTFDRPDRGDERTSYDCGGSERPGETTEGRYPPNVILDETAAEMLDEQTGELSAGHNPDGNGESSIWGSGSSEYEGVGEYTESGGASRYFYTSKASKSERTLDGLIDNSHPTVKPVDLMEWLVKLVSARGQTVIDPFSGTGTTCRAAKNLDRRYVGIEQSEKWADVARVRCGMSPRNPEHVRGDAAQRGVGDF